MSAYLKKPRIWLIDSERAPLAENRAVFEPWTETVYFGPGSDSMNWDDLPDAILLSAEIPGGAGGEPFAFLRRAAGATPILAVSRLRSLTQALAYFRAGAADYLSLPLDGEEVRLRLEDVLQKAADLALAAMTVEIEPLEPDEDDAPVEAASLILEIPRETPEIVAVAVSADPDDVDADAATDADADDMENANSADAEEPDAHPDIMAENNTAVPQTDGKDTVNFAAATSEATNSKAVNADTASTEAANSSTVGLETITTDTVDAKGESKDGEENRIGDGDGDGEDDCGKGEAEAADNDPEPVDGLPIPTLWEELPCGLLVFDSIGNLVFSNSLGLELFGRQSLADLQDALENRLAAFAAHGVNQKPLADNQWPQTQARKSRAARSAVISIEKPDRRRVWLRIDCLPHLADGKINRMCMTLVNLTGELPPLPPPPPDTPPPTPREKGKKRGKKRH